MTSLVPRLVQTIALVAVVSTGATQAQSGQARMTGRVTDGSGGALPGVTVTVAGPALAKPVVVVTDHVGQYQTPPIPADTYSVTFEMSGFESRTNPAVVLRADEIFILDRQLGLASLQETVTVTGAAPAQPPAPMEPLPPLRQTPKLVPIPREALASVCGPEKPEGADVSVGHIVAHRDDPNRELYGPGDILVLDVGADMGMTAGQNFVVRRRFQYGDKGVRPKFATFGGQAAGLLQVVETSPETAVAAVVYACGEFMAGDTIEPFDPLPVVAPQVAGEPQFDDPARIVFGELGQVTAAPSQLMVIDRGSERDVQRGQRITIFRRSLKDRGPVVRVGDGVVLAVRPQSATVRIDRSTDIVEVGDMVALHRTVSR